jgi:hypothetical protein
MPPQLSHVESRPELLRLVNAHRPKEFLFYSQHSKAKRLEICSLLAAIGITRMPEWKCLDIGPGYGDSLDVWRELGATECAFIERDPWLFTHNRLKPFAHGWEGNHIFKLGLLPWSHFNFIWCRGGVSHKSSYFRLTLSRGLKRWLSLLERSAAHDSHIVVSPYQQTRWMNRVFEASGYRALRSIEGHTTNLYPVTWHKTKRERSESHQHSD